MAIHRRPLCVCGARVEGAARGRRRRRQGGQRLSSIGGWTLPQFASSPVRQFASSPVRQFASSPTPPAKPNPPSVIPANAGTHGYGGPSDIAPSSPGPRPWDLTSAGMTGRGSATTGHNLEWRARNAQQRRSSQSHSAPNDTARFLVLPRRREPSLGPRLRGETFLARHHIRLPHRLSPSASGSSSRHPQLTPTQNPQTSAPTPNRNQSLAKPTY